MSAGFCSARSAVLCSKLRVLDTASDDVVKSGIEVDIALMVRPGSG